MSQVTKNQLIYENSTYFPNNNSGAITPADLRAFNVDMIDSTVNQTIYNEDSNSFDGRINEADTQIGILQQFTQSQEEFNATVATTGSNTFVGTQTINDGQLIMHNGGVDVSIFPDALVNGLYISSDNVYVSGDLNASLPAGYVWLGDAFGRAQAVPSSSIAAGGSTDLGPLNAYTASNNQKWSDLGAKTGSYATTGSNIFTGNQTINANLIVSGTITAHEIHTIIESSSVIFSSGSNILGDDPNTDTQTLNGTTTINGNQTINNGNLTLNTDGASITLQKNAQGSGSAYTGLVSIVDTLTDPTNVFSAYQFVDNNAGINFGFGYNSYTPVYTGAIPMMFGGGLYNGTDTIWAVPAADRFDIWKPTHFKGGAVVSGSLLVNGQSVVTSNQTGSLLNTSLNAFTASQETKNSTLATYTASVDTKFSTIGSQSGSWVNTSLNAFTASQQNLNATYATTGSNIFRGNQIVSGNIEQRSGNSIFNGNLTVSGAHLIVNGVNDDAITINDGSLNVAQGIKSYGQINVLGGSGISIQSNLEGSGSAYAIGTAAVDNTTDPTNVYSAWQLPDVINGTNLSLCWNSYTGDYTGYYNSTAMIVSPGFYNGTDAAIIFPNNAIEMFKPTTFKASTIVSGSVRGNVVNQSISSNTASLDFSTSNFFEVTLAASTTTRIHATNVKPGQTINLKITQPGLATGSVTFDSNFKFPAVAPYTASAALNAVDIVTFITFADTSSIYSAAVKNMI